MIANSSISKFERRQFFESANFRKIMNELFGPEILLQVELNFQPQFSAVLTLLSSTLIRA